MSRSWTPCLNVKHSGSQKMREPACNLVTGVLAVIVCEVCFKIRQYVSKDDFGRLRPLPFSTSNCVEEAHLSFWRQANLAVTVQLSYVCQGCLSWSWTYIVCLPDCLAMRLVLQSTAVGKRWPTMFCRICNILIYMQEAHILLTKYLGHVDTLGGKT